jgi:hypothetical protein
MGDFPYVSLPEGIPREILWWIWPFYQVPFPGLSILARKKGGDVLRVKGEKIIGPRASSIYYHSKVDYQNITCVNILISMEYKTTLYYVKHHNPSEILWYSMICLVSWKFQGRNIFVLGWFAYFSLPIDQRDHIWHLSIWVWCTLLTCFVHCKMYFVFGTLKLLSIVISLVVPNQ